MAAPSPRRARPLPDKEGFGRSQAPTSFSQCQAPRELSSGQASADPRAQDASPSQSPWTFSGPSLSPQPPSWPPQPLALTELGLFQI